MKTLVYSTHGFDRPFLEECGLGKIELAFTTQQLSPETAHLAKGFDAVAIFSSDNASTEVLETLHLCGVRFIALRSVGHDHVDLSKAKELNMKVANVPAYSPYAIAEHAVALILCLNRKLLLGQQLMEENNFTLDKLVGFDLYGKSIGIIGTGKIGAAFARIMNGFGCKIIAYDLVENSELIEQININYLPINELFKNSDIISICCPLNQDTKYLINKDSFSIMKKGVVLINTARGGIVNTADLIEAIESGIVSAAGLDVYEHEKKLFFKDLSDQKIEDQLFEKLRSLDQVMITGHQAFLTNEALMGIASTTIQNLVQWAEKGTSENDL